MKGKLELSVSRANTVFILFVSFIFALTHLRFGQRILSLEFLVSLIGESSVITLLVLPDFIFRKNNFSRIYVLVLQLILLVTSMGHLFYLINTNVGFKLGIIPYQIPEIPWKYLYMGIWQTNLNETVGFVTTYFSKRFYAYIVIGLGTIYYFRKHNKKILVITSPKNIAITLILIFLTSIGFVKESLFVNMYNSYSQYKNYFQAMSAIGDDERVNKKEKDEIHVIIIGESLSRNHLQLYGYPRETTPLLSNRKDLIVFSDATAPASHTELAIPKIITNESYSLKTYKSYNIISIFNNADIETWWISNQGRRGSYDTLVGQYASAAQNQIFLEEDTLKSNTFHYDHELIPILENSLKSYDKKSKVIFVHLAGSHTPYRNYTPEYDRFIDDPLKQKAVGNLPEELQKNKPNIDLAKLKEDINKYDNTVSYNDYIVNSILKIVESTGLPATVTYFPDHGEAPIFNEGHTSEIRNVMLEVPLIIWCSNEYKARYPETVKNLENNKNEKFLTEDMFYLMLSITGVDSRLNNNEFSLASNFYKSRPRVTYSGKSYDYRTESIVNARRNLEFIKYKYPQLYSKITVDKIDTLMTAQDVLLGFPKAKINLCYVPDRGLITKDNETLVGADIAEILSILNHKQDMKFILTIENFDGENGGQIVEILNKLDRLYQLRSKTMIEIPFGSDSDLLVSNGWNAGCFLTKNSFTSNENLAESISNYIASNHLSSISFDAEDYPLVKMYLEPHLSPLVRYNIAGKGNISDNISPIYDTLNQKCLFDNRILSFTFGLEDCYNLGAGSNLFQKSGTSQNLKYLDILSVRNNNVPIIASLGKWKFFNISKNEERFEILIYNNQFDAEDRSAQIDMQVKPTLFKKIGLDLFNKKYRLAIDDGFTTENGEYFLLVEIPRKNLVNIMGGYSIGIKISGDNNNYKDTFEID